MKSNSDKYRYLRHARRRFLAGTGCSSPERAVAKGQRSIEEWARIVREELERQMKTASHSAKTHVRSAAREQLGLIGEARKGFPASR